MFVYMLDQGASVSIGTSDKKTVLYVDRGGERLYPTTAKQAVPPEGGKPSK